MGGADKRPLEGRPRVRARTAKTTTQSEASSPQAQAKRTSADTWVQAGFDLLAEDGVRALKIDRLCARLNVTKGSFYWHFADMGTYRAALIEAWSSIRDIGRQHIEQSSDMEPRQRLSLMVELMLTPRLWSVEHAMREWAKTDDAAAAGVRMADLRILQAVQQVMQDAGLTDEEAALRAGLLFAAGVGFQHLSGPNPRHGVEPLRVVDFFLPARDIST